MKVLFAVNNENVSEEIVKKYQKDYKEIVSFKNVYYFNAIIKEMQRDKSYDRIVISEDLEPFANNNYDTIDKFLFEKLDSISDEATDNGEKEAQIILICSDRRSKSDGLLVKLFGIGVYSAIIGKDRSIEEVCRLINNPRTKKEAKQYYRIDSDDVNYQTENDADVKENEIQSILKHYKSLGKNEEKYVESFNNIASQYTDAQLRIIIKFLPLNVKAVLEEKSPKYQQIVMFGDQQYKKKDTTNIGRSFNNSEKTKKKASSALQDELKIDAIENRVNNPLTGKPIIIPSAVKKQKTMEVERKLQNIEQAQQIKEPVVEEKRVEQVVPTEVKRGRGRPKKVVEEQVQTEIIEPVKRGRGRPKKVVEESVEPFNIAENENAVLPGIENEPTTLPGVEDDFVLPGVEEQIQNVPEPDYEVRDNNYRLEEQDNYDYNQNNQIERKTDSYNFQNYSGLDNLITGDKKIVTFVGSAKNGTSFIVNNLAMLFSSMGIDTAILDVTENRNSYYIYTKNEEELRKKAYTSIAKLRDGVADGISVNKNLSVYTSMPGESSGDENAEEILKTLVNKHALILIDCDFNTPLDYFDKSQEIYLVQSMDVLTIQPFTAFLRDLKNKGILKQEKLKIIINKYAKIRGLTEKVLIGGMAFYNSPSMSFMSELFNKDMIKSCSIPLDTNTYIAYLEAMVSCEISLNRYSKDFMQSLQVLAGMVYPLLNRRMYTPKGNKKGNQDASDRGYFSPGMNSALEQMNKMRNNY